MIVRPIEHYKLKENKIFLSNYVIKKKNFRKIKPSLFSEFFILEERDPNYNRNLRAFNVWTKVFDLQFEPEIRSSIFNFSCSSNLKCFLFLLTLTVVVVLILALSIS